MTSTSPSTNLQSPLLKPYIKAPEGRYELHHEKTHPTTLLHYSHAKIVSQFTIADLKEKPAAQTVANPPPATSGASMKTMASRLLGGAGKTGVSVPASFDWSSNSSKSNFDDKGTYLVFNAGDAVYISDLVSPDKDPLKSIQFGNSNPVCHAFDAQSDGHDLLIGLQNGDIYSVSLRQQLLDAGKKLIGSQHYNKDGVITNSQCTCIAWVPEGDGVFVVGHADGNIYVYEKGKDGTADCSFPFIKDQSQFSIVRSRSNKSNPVARWHICQGSINYLSFSTNRQYLATVGRDGYLRVFDFANEQLICGGKSYYGALLCCAWSLDGKYVLTGGEDDLVQVWSIEERKLVAWGEGHNSWVSGVAFDSYWTALDSNETGENVVYRFASVGQDTQMLFWDLSLEEIAVPHCPPGGSPTLSRGGHSTHWDNIYPPGTLQPSPSMRDVPKLSPAVAHRLHVEPLSGVIFTNESVLTICREGHIKVWARPFQNDKDQSTASDVGGRVAGSFDNRPILTSTESGFKQPTAIIPLATVQRPC